MKGTDRERITSVSILMSRCLDRMRDSSYVSHAYCQDNIKLPPCFSEPAQGVFLPSLGLAPVAAQQQQHCQKHQRCTRPVETGATVTMVQKTAPPHLLRKESSRQSAFTKYRARRLKKQSEKGWRQQLMLQGEHDFVKPLKMIQSTPDQWCECYSTKSCSAGKSGWALSALLLLGRMKSLPCQAAPLSIAKQGTLLSTVHKQ